MRKVRPTFLECVIVWVTRFTTLFYVDIVYWNILFQQTMTNILSQPSYISREIISHTCWKIIIRIIMFNVLKHCFTLKLQLAIMLGGLLIIILSSNQSKMLRCFILMYQNECDCDMVTQKSTSRFNVPIYFNRIYIIFFRWEQRTSNYRCPCLPKVKWNIWSWKQPV